jgi:inorganic phosphate transporter, PiT family
MSLVLITPLQLTSPVAHVASPILGFLGGGFLMVTVSWVFRRANYGRVMPSFRYAQWLSAACMAFSHGRNDAQKPMGILALAIALYYTSSQVTVPLWIVVSCASVAALGTACGGWRIIRTMGMRITRLNFAQGFASEVAGATVIQLASSMGIPISTTQAITSSILGVGATRRLSAIRWGVTSEILFSWVLTLPATLLLGAGYVLFLGLFFS